MQKRYEEVATLFKVSLLHRQIVVEVATEMVRWKVLGTDRCAAEIRAAGGVESPQSEQQEVVERQQSELQLVLHHRREVVVCYLIYPLYNHLCPLSSQVG